METCSNCDMGESGKCYNPRLGEIRYDGRGFALNGHEMSDDLWAKCEDLNGYVRKGAAMRNLVKMIRESGIPVSAVTLSQVPGGAVTVEDEDA